MEFVSVKKIFLRNISNSKFMSVPCSKSDIFNTNDLQLFEKQKLLNFIHSVMKLKNTNLDVNTTSDLKKDYEVEDKLLEEIKNNLNNDADEFLNSRFSPLLIDIIKTVLANLDPNYETKLTLDNLTDHIYKYLNSLLVYDVTPFIYPLYGSSEYSQALCRMSSVFQTIFIVNDSLKINIFENNEHLIYEGAKKFIINVYDSSKYNLIIRP
jgi:RAB protein geranylgeranyltransferase component A